MDLHCSLIWMLLDGLADPSLQQIQENVQINVESFVWRKEVRLEKCYPSINTLLDHEKHPQWSLGPNLENKCSVICHQNYILVLRKEFPSIIQTYMPLLS